MLNDLRKASYNKISFYVTASTTDFGRRTVTHEYPQGDVPFVEDLGKATKKFTVTAFVLGDDYITRAKRLEKELEKPVTEDGGTLIHPWYGSIKVCPVDKTKISWNLDRRIATLTINFIEAGNLRNPSISTAWASFLLDKANEFYKSILGDFDPDVASGYVTEIATAVNGVLGTLSDSSFIKLLDMGSNINNLAAEMSELLIDTDKLKDTIISELSIANLAATTNDWQKITSASASARKGLYAKTILATTQIDLYTPVKAASIIKSTASLESAFRFMLLGNAVAGTAYIGTDLDQNLEGTRVKAFAEDVLQIRDDLMKALEEEMILTGDDDSDLYSMLEDTHSAVYNHLTSVASELGTVITIKPQEVTNSLALAYEQYGDASRDLEIVQRNNIPNPLFLPTETLKVSST